MGVLCKGWMHIFSANLCDLFTNREPRNLILSRPRWKSVKVWPLLSFHQLCKCWLSNLFSCSLSHHLSNPQCLNICIYKMTAWKDWKGESPKFTCDEQLSESYKLWFFVSENLKTGVIDFFSFTTSSFKCSSRIIWII